MTKNLILFLMIIFIGIAGYYFARFGYYPVAFVNGEMITARALQDEHAAAFQYYIRTLTQKPEFDPRSPEVQRELRRASLHDLVDKELISQELERRVGKDLGAAVAGRISGANLDNKVLADAAKLLYGLELADFKEMVLVPQAKKELLEGSLFLEQKKFDAWLAEAEAAASVTILTPEFAWDKTKVVLRAK